MGPQYRQGRSYLVGSISRESAHQFDCHFQSLQQGIYGDRRRQSLLRHPGKIERTEIWTALNSTRVDFLLEFAKRSQASLDRIPAEASNEADQSGLENR